MADPFALPPTTPEQMREAAAKCCDINNVSPNFSAPAQSISTAMAIAAAIRAIPIAPQPAEASPLAWEQIAPALVFPDGWRGDMGLVEQELWAHGFQTCREQVAERLSALTIQPADPLSDPRVVALVEELREVEAHIKRGHLPDALNVIYAALRAIGGEA